MCDFTEDNNKHRFNKAQLREIYGYTKQLVSYLQAHPELQEGCPKTEQELYLARNGYLVGEQSLEEYRESLLRIIGELDPKDFSARSMYMRFTAAQEYILTLHARAVEEEQKKILHVIYEDIAAYAYHLPKTGVLSFMLTFLSNLLRHYIKVSDGSVFRDICLKIMAAMHPPTYVHTLSVAGITRYLAEQLFRRDPSRFIGIAGAKTKEEVLRKKDKILSFIYNAAMLHDVGKLFIIETIITYGRDLVEAEWKLIQAHTVVGAALLRRVPETAAYAEIAEGHHRWFDNSQGYPETFDMQSARYPTVLSLLSAADCIDAATDSIGRSYKTGKTLEDCITELQNGSGSRYAPYVVELFSDPQIKADLQRLLNEGRDENYRKTYDLLKTL